MTDRPEPLNSDEYRTLIQVLNHMLLETEDSEFYTLIGVPKADGEALQKKLKSFQQAV